MSSDAETKGAGPRCPSSGKRSYRNVEQARTHGRAFARHLNARGDIAASMYTYTCPDCGRIHLTRMDSWRGEALHLVFKAPSIELQLWGMTGDGAPLPESAREDRDTEHPKPHPRPRPKRRGGGPHDMVA